MNRNHRTYAAALSILLLAVVGYGQMISWDRDSTLVASSWSGSGPEAIAVTEATSEERIAAAFGPAAETSRPATDVAARFQVASSSVASTPGTATSRFAGREMHVTNGDQPSEASASGSAVSGAGAHAAPAGNPARQVASAGAAPAAPSPTDDGQTSDPVATAADGAPATAGVASSGQPGPAAERGARAAQVRAVAAHTRERAERRLDAIARRIDAEARVSGEAQVSERMAAELGVDAGALRAAREVDAWSEIVIAHTLRSSARAKVSASGLLNRHRLGASWSEIIAGLRLDLDGAVRAVSAEARVLSGQARADGRVAAIHGAGSRFGVDAMAGATAPGVGVGLGAGVGASVSGLGVLPPLRTGP